MTSLTTAATVLNFDTETDVAAILKHATGGRTSYDWKRTISCVYASSASPGPTCEHLDDIIVSWFGPQQPGVAAILQEVPVVWPTVSVEDVVTMEMLHPTNLMQLIVLRIIREVEGPQHCLLQDNVGTLSTTEVLRGVTGLSSSCCNLTSYLIMAVISSCNVTSTGQTSQNY